jgi:hypothetical protein
MRGAKRNQFFLLLLFLKFAKANFEHTKISPVSLKIEVGIGTKLVNKSPRHRSTLRSPSSFSEVALQRINLLSQPYA